MEAVPDTVGPGRGVRGPVAGGGIPAASRASTMAWANSMADAYRSSAVLASARRTAGTASRGRAAAAGASKGGGSWRCLKMVAIGVCPRKGTLPVKSSKATIPSA